MAECKAILAVVEDPNKVKESPPQFAAQMRDLSIQIGEPATFDVEIIGQPRPDVYWTKNGNRLGPSARYKFILEQNHVTLLFMKCRRWTRVCMSALLPIAWVAPHVLLD
jgi:hypothetical protein